MNKLRFILMVMCMVHPCTSEIADRFELTDILPEDVKTYDKLDAPVVFRNPNDPFDYDPAIVRSRVTVLSIDSINEASMTYTADIFFAQKWKDNRLRFPNNMTYEYRALDVDWLTAIWRPDSFFKNAKSVQFQQITVPNHYVWLYRDKTILYMMKLTLQLSCAMNFAVYPHDTQECKMQIESLSHTTDDLVFEWDSADALVIDDDLQLPQLALVNSYQADCTHPYPSGNFTCLEIVFVLKRSLGYYLIHTYIPTCLIVIISWISFWIKPEAIPARISLGVTSLLTLSTQHAKSQASLPPVSYLKTVDTFMSTSTIFVFMSLMEICLVNVILGDFVTPKKTAKKQKKGTGKISIVSQSYKSNFENDDKKGQLNGSDRMHYPSISSLGSTSIDASPSQENSESSSSQKRLQHALLVDRISRVLFPTLFIVLNCVYWLWALFYEYVYNK